MRYVLVEFAACLISSAAFAQTALVLDGSLPNGRTDDLVATQPGPVYTVDQSMGAVSGSNLFHSFQNFSIGAGATADFTALQPFNNLILRVTGGNASTINGTLRSSVLNSSGGGADFFFLNPAGILFGANSQIDVPGNLYLSTADELRFDDGAVLDLRKPADPVLSVAEPEAFGFLGGAPAADVEILENSGGFGFLSLSMQPGTTLAAVGGGVRVASTGGLVFLQTPGGRTGLVAAGAANSAVDVQTLDIATTDPELLGTVSVGPGAAVTGLDVANLNGDQGEIVVRGGRLEISGADFSFGGNAGTGNPAIDILVSDAIDLTGGGAIVLPSSGSNQGGSGSLVAADILISGAGSGVLTQNAGPGGGGDLLIQADRIVVENGGQITTSVESLGIDPSGAGGDIQIVVGEIEVRDGGLLSTRTDTSGPGGDIEVIAARVDVVDGKILSRGNTDAPGGALRLAAEDLTIQGALAEISTVQAWMGAPGSALELGTGSGSILVTDSALVQSQTVTSQDGSSILISTGRVEVSDGARIETSSLASGDAGSIEVNAMNVEVTRSAGALAGGLITSSAVSGSTGSGGLIHVTTVDLTVSGGGQINTSTAGGSAGAIDIDSTGNVLIVGDDGLATPSGISARVLVGATGSSGGIDIEARSIAVDEGAQISTRSSGTGSSGDVSLVATEAISITGTGLAGSLVSAQGLVGAGGDVLLNAPDVVVADGAGVDVATAGANAGGRLTIRGENLTVRGTSPDGFLRSTLAAEARSFGDAGGIDIQLSGDLTIEDDGRVSTRSVGSGTAGDISIAARSAHIDSGGAIEARSTQSADAGSIAINVSKNVQLRNSQITTEAAQALGGLISISAGNQIQLDKSSVASSVGAGLGSGGDISLNAPFVILNDGNVIARAVGGNGGNIQITTEVLIPSAGSVIDASSTLGVDGEISTTSPATDLSGQITNLTTEFFDASNQLIRDCGSRTERAGSFIIESTPRQTNFDEDVIDLEAPMFDGRRGITCDPR